jgi:hypothetical protein
MLSTLLHIPKKDALPGDLVVFGPGTGEHVVILLQPGTVTDPHCISHGTEAGPWVETISGEAAAHDAPTTWLRGVKDLPAKPDKTWDIFSNDKSFHDTTHHPAIWATRHPRKFRTIWTLSFHRRS